MLSSLFVALSLLFGHCEHELLGLGVRWAIQTSVLLVFDWLHSVDKTTIM